MTPVSGSATPQHGHDLRRAVFILWLVSLAAALVACRPAAVKTDLREFQKGIAFTGYSGTAYDGQAPLRSLDEVRRTNASSISLLVTGLQKNIDSTTIDFTGPDTPGDASLERIIRHAHRLGLKVLLKPHVDFTDDPAHYRGEIGPGFGDSDWAAWFASYRPFIIHYAELAARTRCELFSVGCELGTTAVRGAEWRGIVAAVRKVYPGPLVYADNLIEENPEAVTWWDAVDLIGQDAYPTLTRVERPSVEDLLEGWAVFRDKLRRLSEKWGKPVILTEIGCRSLAGGAQNPWDWQRSGAVDLEVQKNFYDAACRAVSGQDWLRGLYWWSWSPDPEDGGPRDTGYSPHGKPAEEVLRKAYGRLR